MTFLVFSIQHDRHGLPEVERASLALSDAQPWLSSAPQVRGALVLSTCNRVEVMFDSDRPHRELRALVDRHFDRSPGWQTYIGETALRHVFRVASGLDSMVIGEREIAGQLRRTLQDAKQSGHTSLLLNTVVDEALRTSRKVANHTALEGAGRSVVSVGLDRLGIEDWGGQRVLLVGTGSYAGAVIAALRARSVGHIAVHSSTGRGEEFAETHGLIPSSSFAGSLACSTLVVTCRGRGGYAVTADDVAALNRPLRLLDLSLLRDVEPSAGRLPGVTLIDLTAVQEAVQPEWAADTASAELLVEVGVSEALTKLRSRVVDPAVVSLRESVMALVDEEVQRLPSGNLTSEDAARALRRLATRLLHVPSSRARLAAEEGRTDAYLEAMAELYGIAVPHPVKPLEKCECPVTGLRVSDLAVTRPVHEEAV
ncbi:MAG TPA: glutamyl-tRNA reductase [Arachnia sp.]|nr:glutamyl-tRNA reductase [Arachnia sp.]HMT86674.1 glutamyl-tRNA reductase [Arachnia sp.]